MAAISSLRACFFFEAGQPTSVIEKRIARRVCMADDEIGGHLLSPSIP